MTGTGLCEHHTADKGEDWHLVNRIMCDFFHRGRPIPRLSPHERSDDFWAIA
jgi:hypothetical protein